MIEFTCFTCVKIIMFCFFSTTYINDIQEFSNDVIMFFHQGIPRHTYQTYLGNMSVSSFEKIYLRKDL